MTLLPQITSGDLVLTPIVATVKNRAGYGWIMGHPTGVEHDKINFYGREVSVTNPADFRSEDTDTCLNLVNFTERPLEVRWMEYHTKHTQTFIPLSGKPFCIVLGKPTQRQADGSWDESKKPEPNLEDVKAFYFDGSAGIVLCIGTWHELPFPTAGNTNFIVILTHETIHDLGVQDENGEAKGGDLDKVRIRRRFGHGIFIQP